MEFFLEEQPLEVDVRVLEAPEASFGGNRGYPTDEVEIRGDFQRFLRNGLQWPTRLKSGFSYTLIQNLMCWTFGLRRYVTLHK